MSSLLKQLQLDAAGLLNTCDYFEDITVVAEDKADLSTVIQQSLSAIAAKNGKSGLVVIIEEPTAEAPTQLSGPYLTLVKLKVLIMENLMVNRTDPYGTQKIGYEVAEAICEVLFQAQLDGTGTNPLWPGQPAIRSLGALPDLTEIMGVEVNLEAHIALPSVAKVATPTITNTTGSITLASTTGGAALLYSLDGSFPSLVYTAPFATPDAGTRIRAIGTKTGQATSDIGAHQL